MPPIGRYIITTMPAVANKTYTAFKTYDTTVGVFSIIGLSIGYIAIPIYSIVTNVNGAKTAIIIAVAK